MTSLVDFAESRRQTMRPWQTLLAEIAREHGVTVADITGPSRSLKLIPARFHACFEMRHRLEMSVTEIGRRVNRDHSTVIHALRRWPEIVRASQNEQAEIQEQAA